MKLFKILLYIALLSSTIYAEGLKPTLADGNITNHYAVRIYYDTEELRLKIVTTFEPLEMNKQEHYVVVEVDEEEHQKLLNLELNVSVDSNNTEKLNYTPPASKQHNNTQIESTQGYPTIPNFSCYRTVEGTFSTAEDIVSQHPNLAQWIDVGDSWKKENGLGGYDMKVLKITNLAHTGPKPALFITSSIHAREYAPAELATRFAEYLVSHYGTDADITWMLDYHEVHLMLMANPDGRKEAEAGDSWRKNVNNNYCVYGSRKGADLNRNFNFRWNCCSGSSSNECSQTYHGPTPASEPETQAIQTYMLNLFGDHRADNLNAAAALNTSGIYLDIHSYSELILWPWGTTGTTAPNNMVSLGRKFAYSNHYIPKQSYGLYPTDGTTGDYGYGELGIPSYTFELGTRFFQDCNIFNQTIVPDNMPSLLYALKAVRAPYTLSMGPEIKNITLNVGTTTSQGTLVRLTARADDTLYSNAKGSEPTQNIVQAEYYIDTPPWVAGAHAIAMSASDNRFNSPNELITQTIDTSTLHSGKHTIFVRAKDASNNWGTVSAVFLTIKNNPDTVPTAPSNLVVTNITKTTATLTWQDKSNNETGFKIYRNGHNTPIHVSSNISSKTITGLTPNTSYTYIVKAYNNAGESVGIRKTFRTKTNTAIIPVITLNSKINGTWDVGTASTHRKGRYAKFYTFTLTQSTQVMIDLTSSKDTYLYLLQGKNKNGTEITHDDDGGSGVNSKITRTLSAGTYTIESTTYSKSTTGAFVLKVSTGNNVNTIPTIPLNANQHGTWDRQTTSTHRRGRYAKFYTFKLRQRTQVKIDLSSSKDTYLYLLQGKNRHGAQITYNDDSAADNFNSKIIRTLNAGTYTLEATTYSRSTTGTFVLKVRTSTNLKY